LHPHHQTVYGPGGISQGLLGQWLGLQQPQISRIETGSPIRDLDTLVYWARVLKIPPEMLWFDLPGETRQAVASVLESSVDSLSDDDRSHELVELLNSLTASRFPVLDDQHTKRVGVSALEGASLSERAQLILRLFLQLDDELGGDVLYLPLSRYVARLGVSAGQRPADGLAAFGQLSQMTGWIALDGNRRISAALASMPGE
jgi:transcriptional regulator with XRE-family HTH domain